MLYISSWINVKININSGGYFYGKRKYYEKKVINPDLRKKLKDVSFNIKINMI